MWVFMYELVLFGRFVLNGEIVGGSIGIDNGFIIEIFRRDIKGEEVIVFKSEIILLGLIDIYVYLRDFE